MANSKISQLSSLTGSVAASNDVLPIVDVSDSTMAATGTTKKITLTELQSAPVSAGTANGVMYLNGSKVPTAGSGLVFDPSGNLALGVTPSGWDSGIKALDIGVGSALINPGSNLQTWMLTNAYFKTTQGFTYKNTGAAGYYQQNAATHAWFNAPSGTAGAAIPFTQAMTLDASGNLMVGTTNALAKLDVRRIDAGAAAFFWKNDASANTVIGTRQERAIGATSGTQIDFGAAGGTSVGSITSTGSATAYNTSSDYRLKDNQKPLTGSGEFIDALKPKTWDWKADGSRGVGFIAHEVQEVSPTSVVGEKDATRIEQYEISPAVPAVLDEEGNVVTPAVEAVMGEREVPAYQAMEYGSAEFIANIVAELQSLRKRVAALEAGGI